MKEKENICHLGDKHTWKKNHVTDSSGFLTTKHVASNHDMSLLYYHGPRVELSAVSPKDRTAGFSALLSPAEIICQVGLTLDVNGRGQRGVKTDSGSDEQHMTRTSSLVSIIPLPSVLIHFTTNLERNIFFNFILTQHRGRSCRVLHTHAVCCFYGLR